MGVPEPIYPLSDHCSVIHDGTLYVYSPAGFQSLSLQEGGKWKQMPMDISLTGAVCVKVVPEGDANAAMLYVVGGSPNATASPWNYPGLMYYSFAENKWEWVRPTGDWITQNRKNHAATYLPDSKSILIYAGSQSTDTRLSQETFTISTVEPFYVDAKSTFAPPAIKPVLLPWDSSHAVMIGTGTNAVYTYSPNEGWRDLGVALTEPIGNQEAIKCTVISGEDDSKVLAQFDMSVSPNKVTRTALLNQGGTIAPGGTTVGDKAKRVTLQNWPAYNGTLAPTVTRSGYSIAQGDDDLVVVTGGSDEDPLCIFDQQNNTWINATELFEGKQLQSVLQPSSSGSSTPTATPSATSSPTAAALPAAGSVNNKDKMLTVLGATLGAIFGIAALLILFLFCLKRRKAKNKDLVQDGYVEKNRLSFADRGAEFMSEAGGSVRYNKFGEVNSSQTSLAIMSGRPAGHKKGGLSDASTSGLVKKTSPLGYSEPVELSKFDLKPEPMEETIVRQNSGRIPPQPRTLAAANVSRSRSSGWSRYFANNEATNLAQIPDRSTFASERTSTASQSMYTDSRMFSQPPQPIPPLDVPKFDGQRFSRVAKGSPTLGNSTENLPGQPMQAELARADSNGSTRSGRSHDDHFLRDPVDSWSPVTGSGRPASSDYTGSVIIEDYRNGASSYYADNTSSLYPKSNVSSFYPGQPKFGASEGRESSATMFPSSSAPPQIPPSNFGSQLPMPPRAPGAPEGRESTVTVFPSSTSANNAQSEAPQSRFSSFYAAPPRLGAAPEGRESTVTVFPRAAPEGAPKNGQQDMSWLNLGAGK